MNMQVLFSFIAAVYSSFLQGAVKKISSKTMKPNKIENYWIYF
jgi:hypothetical protein